MIGLSNHLTRTRFVTNQPTDALASIIRELLDTDRFASNPSMALEASDQLGQSITVDQISRTRRRIGLGKNVLRQQDTRRANMQFLFSVDAFPRAEEAQLTVSDVAESVAFYKKIGGTGIEQESGIGTVTIGRQALWLTSGHPLSEPHTFVISIRYLDLYRSFLRDEHVSFLERDTPGGQERELVLSDPDGHSLIVREASTS